jgi:hypothetical protein
VNNLSKSKLDDKISMFVGMDLHKNYLQIAVSINRLDKEAFDGLSVGQLVSTRLGTPLVEYVGFGHGV